MFTRPHRSLPLIAGIALTVSLIPAAGAQDLSAVDVSGQWSVKFVASFASNQFGITSGTGKGNLYLTQTNSVITGLVIDKLGKCAAFELPATGTRSGSDFTVDASGQVTDLFTCTSIGTTSTSSFSTLSDNAKASATGTGSATALQVPLAFTSFSTLKRVSGRQTPTDPDGPDGPAVPLSLIGKGEPGTGGVHDLAVIKLTVPKSVKAKLEPLTKVVKVKIQNRSQHVEIIEDAAMLAALIDLDADVTSGAVSAPVLTPRLVNESKFPILLKPRGKYTVSYDALFAGPATPTDPAVTGTISYTARVLHEMLAGGLPDDHPEDDVAPRSIIAPFTFDTFPDGSIKEKGVGAKKQDKTFGDPVLTQLTVGAL